MTPRAGTADVALIGALATVTAGLLTLPSWPRFSWLLVVGGALLLLAIVAIVRERTGACRDITDIVPPSCTPRRHVFAGQRTRRGGVGGSDVTTG